MTEDDTPTTRSRGVESISVREGKFIVNIMTDNPLTSFHKQIMMPRLTRLIIPTVDLKPGWLLSGRGAPWSLPWAYSTPWPSFRPGSPRMNWRASLRVNQDGYLAATPSSLRLVAPKLVSNLPRHPATWDKD